MDKYREILRLYSSGMSKRGIEVSCRCSMKTINKVVERANEVGIDYKQLPDISEQDLADILFPNRITQTRFRQPDYKYIHKEMAKNGVTMKLLWHEYCESCDAVGDVPYMYTQFCKYYRDWAVKTKATMRIEHKPGERLEVDWAGKKMSLKDNVNGGNIPVNIFVTALPYSGYAYVEGFLKQDMENWITAHVNAYRFFGGSTRILVPDNLKTGVSKLNWYTPTISRTYHEMSEHYGTAIIPARVRKPKDKPSVEGAVGNISTWIIAALRNQQFFSLWELNEVVMKKLELFNAMPFQKKPGNRLEVFLEEKEYLLPLPIQAFELAEWRVATVQMNYHIAIHKQNYSVPYEYLRRKVDVRITKDALEVFCGGNRIASHARLHGRPGQYRTVIDHMPPNHQKYVEWNGDRFRRWAASIGKDTESVVSALLDSFKVEQQGYRSCMGLLKLADKYSVSRLEAACGRALSYTANPGYRNVQTILQNGSDKLDDDAASQNTDEHAFTRGAEYYGRKDK